MARRLEARWTLVGLLAALALIAGGCGGDDPSGGRDDEACDPACAEDETCEAGVCVPGHFTDEDGDGVGDGADRCPGTPAGARVDGNGCAIEQATVPAPDGPFGTGIRDFADDFTVSTLDGAFSLRASWTGRDAYLFLLHHAGSAYAEAIWASSPERLFAESPPNVHYFFLSTAQAAADREAVLTDLRGRVEAGLDALDARDHWAGRVHFVTDALEALDGGLGDFVAAHGYLAFAIDRFGRWREVGMLQDITVNPPTAEMRFLAAEARGFEFEHRLAWELDAIAAAGATEVVVFDGDRHDGGWEEGYATSVEIQLPPAAEMARFDSMAVFLYTACPDHLQGRDAGCNEWDYAHHLFLCDADDPARCDTELVRYVTPYGREGAWLTDVSGLLPLVAEGGRRTLRYEGANGYDMHLRILLWDAGKPFRPVEALPLWGNRSAIPWDGTYNDRFEPIAFQVDDPAAEKVSIYSVVTGHGFGAVLGNCAEFCNSEHEFAVNGTAFVEAHPEANSRVGCFDRIEEGVVPNQFGTWPFGRAGWCPGQDVKPWVQDVSSALVAGENTIAYRALFRGEPYVPVVTDPEAYLPELRLQSWLVRYARR